MKRRVSSLIAFWYNLGVKKIFQIDTGEGREREELTSKFKISGSWEQIESSQKEKREGMNYW